MNTNQLERVVGALAAREVGELLGEEADVRDAVQPPGRVHDREGQELRLEMKRSHASRTVAHVGSVTTSATMIDGERHVAGSPISSRRVGTTPTRRSSSSTT